MSYTQLDLNLLRVFDAIYAERNLTRAAMILHVSQPAVSNALQRLRDALDDPLFIRERRGVATTPYADSIAAPVHDALLLVNSGLSIREKFSPERSQRTFRVSMNDPAEVLFLPSLVYALAAKAPGVNVISSYVGRHELAAQMAIGAVDVAVDVQVADDERFCSMKLIEDTYVCLFRGDHPLLKGKLTLQSYLALDHIHVSARRRGLGHVDRALSECQAKRQIKVRTRNPGLAAAIVQSSDMSMSLPKRMASEYTLKARPLPFKVPPLEWHLYWPVRAEHDPGNMWLRQLISSFAAPLKEPKRAT